MLSKQHQCEFRFPFTFLFSFLCPFQLSLSFPFLYSFPTLSWVPRRPRSVEHVYLFEFRLPFTFLFSFLCPFLIAHRPPPPSAGPKKIMKIKTQTRDGSETGVHTSCLGSAPSQLCNYKLCFLSCFAVSAWLIKKVCLIHILLISTLLGARAALPKRNF